MKADRSGRKRVSIGYLGSIDRELADRLDDLRRYSGTLDAAIEACNGKYAVSATRDVCVGLRETEYALRHAKNLSTSSGQFLDEETFLSINRELLDYEKQLKDADKRFGTSCSCVRKSYLKKML